MGKTYIDMGKNAKKEEIDISVERTSPVTDYAALEKRIRGHSHVPNITKGVYQAGVAIGRMGYNPGPVPWQVLGSNHDEHLDKLIREMKEIEMLKEFYGESMCGDCISVKVTGGHDRNLHKRRRCQLCGTLWPGLEPENDRRQAIADQKAKKRCTPNR